MLTNADGLFQGRCPAIQVGKILQNSAELLLDVNYIFLPFLDVVPVDLAVRPYGEEPLE